MRAHYIYAESARRTLDFSKSQHFHFKPLRKKPPSKACIKIIRRPLMTCRHYLVFVKQSDPTWRFSQQWRLSSPLFVAHKSLLHWSTTPGNRNCHGLRLLATELEGRLGEKGRGGGGGGVDRCSQQRKCQG